MEKQKVQKEENNNNNNNKKTGKEQKEVKREQVHVSIFKFQIQRFSCKNLQKSDKKKH